MSAVTRVNGGTVLDRQTTSGTWPLSYSSPTSFTFTANDLLLLALSIDGASQTVSAGLTGWTLGKNADSGTWGVNIYWRRAVGGDSAPTITWTSGGERGVAQLLQYRDAGDPIFPSSLTTGSGANPNPPSFTHGLGAVDGTYVTFIGNEGQIVASGAPSGYGNLTTSLNGISSGGSFSSADKAALASASDDPAAWTVAAAGNALGTLFIPYQVAASGETPGRLVRGGLLKGRLVGGRLAA